MGSRAVIWNPISSVHNRHRLLVYYNSTKHNLGVRQWSPSDADPWVKVYEEQAHSPQGPVKVGGGFAAVLWRDWIRAYGIIETKISGSTSGSTVTVYYISLLTPVPQSLGITTNYDRLAGTSHQTADGKDKGWLYYLAKDPPLIHERGLDSANSGAPIAKTLKLMNQASPPALTDLSACYSVKQQKRFVFFQTSDGNIHAYDVLESSNTADHIIDGAAAARHGTPLAATSFIHEDKDVIVVYWIHSNVEGFIYRSHSLDCGENWITTSLQSAGEASPETLTVAPNSDLKINALVYNGESSEIQAYSDEWASFKLKP